MADLIEGTYTTGRGVFCPGVSPSNSSEDEDDFINPALLQLLPSSISMSSTATVMPLPIVATPAAVTGLSAPTIAMPSADTDKQSRNGHRKSSSQAIDSMASSISRLADAFTADTDIPSPAWKWAAIHAVEDDGDLSDDEQLKVFNIICHDTGFADTILAIHKKHACTHFIKEELYDGDDD